MHQKHFYEGFNILYEAVKDGISIFQKEELYRILFRDIYLQANDDLYDNDTIRKITTGNNTIHRKALKQLYTENGFDLLRKNIATFCLPKMNDAIGVLAELGNLTCHDPNIPAAVKQVLVSSYFDKTEFQISRFIAAVLVCLDASDYMTIRSTAAFIDVEFMRLCADKAIPIYPKYITNAPNAAVDELFGRADEIQTLYSNIVDKKEKVLLSAVGGLGKTELTKALLNRLFITEVKECGIEELAWIPYDNHDIRLSIKNALHFQCDLDEVWSKLQELTEEKRHRLLVVIDNIESPENDEYLLKLYSFPCRMLATSRQRMLPGFSNVMYLQPLPLEECRTLFYKHYQFQERDNEVVNDIISLTAKLTIMIVFIAKVAYLEGMSLHSLYGALVAKGFKLSEEDVSCEHEKLQNEETIIQQMCILFSLVDYNENERMILTHISIIPNLQFDFPKAKKWFKVKKNSSLMKLYSIGMLEHVTQDKKHIYWMHSVIAAAVREQQKEHLYELSRPFVAILSEEMNTGPVFGKEYEKAYLIPFSWSIADIMENHWSVEDDTNFLTSLFHICFACSNYSLCEKLIDIIIKVQESNSFPCVDIAYSYRNKIDLLFQYDRVEEGFSYFPIVEKLLSDESVPSEHKEILNYQYGIYYQICGDFKKSKFYFEKCIRLTEQEESETKSKDLSTVYTNMARMLVEAGEFYEAYKYAHKAIDADNQDEADADRMVCYSTLASICTELMQAGFGTTYVDEAVDAFEKVIAFREKNLGKHHADTAVIYHDYSYFWYVCQVPERALKYNEMAYRIDEELYSEYSITRLRSLNTKALIIWDQGDREAACNIFEYIISTAEKMSENYLMDIADFQFNYARCLLEQENTESAKVYYKKCIGIWTVASETGNRNLSLANQEYGDILFGEGHPDEAIHYYEESIKYNSEDFYIQVDTMDSLAACFILCRETEKALQKHIELLKMLVEYHAHDAETKYQLCNNLCCILNPESSDEEEYYHILISRLHGNEEILSYVLTYFDDLPEKTEHPTAQKNRTPAVIL